MEKQTNESMLSQQKPYYTHLVMSGGGFCGLVYIGIYRFLKQYGLYNSIKHIYGISIGAIFGFLFGLNIDCEQLESLFLGPENLFTYEELVQYSPKEFITFTQKKGAFSSKKIFKALQVILEKICHMNDITFSEYLKKTGKDLHIYATCLNKHTLEEFSNETTPDMSILKAIEASSSIPFIFQPVEYKDKLYVDGACCNNLPLHMIPITPATKVLAVNLGEEIDVQTKSLLSSLPTYIWSVFHSLIASQINMCIQLYQDKFDILDIQENPIPVVNVIYEKEYIKLYYSKEMIETAILFGYQQLDTFFKKKGYF